PSSSPHARWASPQRCALAASVAPPVLALWALFRMAVGSWALAAPEFPGRALREPWDSLDFPWTPEWPVRLLWEFLPSVRPLPGFRGPFSLFPPLAAGKAASAGRNPRPPGRPGFSFRQLARQVGSPAQRTPPRRRR